MISPAVSALAATAAVVGVAHTLAGPDHYVPFIAMARAGRWSLLRTITVTVLCGIAHVSASIALGLLTVVAVVAVASLEWLESLRGGMAAWLLLGFGFAYALWGLRHAAGGRRHAHRTLGDGAGGDAVAAMPVRATPWVLFTVFAFGPCEPLIPILMYPAAEHGWSSVLVVMSAFTACTLATMVAAVVTGHVGLSRLSLRPLDHYAHALAGSALFACGMAMQLGA